MFELYVINTEFASSFDCYDSLKKLFGFSIVQHIVEETVQYGSVDRFLVYCGSYEDCEKYGEILKEDCFCNYEIKEI